MIRAQRGGLSEFTEMARGDKLRTWVEMKGLRGNQRKRKAMHLMNRAIDSFYVQIKKAKTQVFRL